MKKNYYLLVCFFAVLTGFYFVSCSSDDDDKSSSPLVGTWDAGEGWSGIERIYVMFNADGTGYTIQKYDEKDKYYSGEPYRADKFDYTYNKESGQLTVIGDKDAETYIVVLVKDSKLTLKESEKSSRTKNYTKTSAPISLSQIKELVAQRDYNYPFAAFDFD